ncbi:MAG: hypothetical protein ACTSXQ_07735 [Alphaproteobacteria bacterium]
MIQSNPSSLQSPLCALTYTDMNVETISALSDNYSAFQPSDFGALKIMQKYSSTDYSSSISTKLFSNTARVYESNKESRLERFGKEIDLLSQLGLTHYRGLIDRIMFLEFTVDAEKDDDWPDIKLPSLRSLVIFFSDEKHMNLKEPSLVLTHDGCLRVEWAVARDKFLGIKFIDEGRCEYVLFSPSKDTKNSVYRMKNNDPELLQEQIEKHRWLK